MALKLKNKKEIVSEVAEQASSALSAVVATYRGLTVNQMNELRKQARETSVYLKVVQNNLAKIAVQGTEFECMTSALVGPLVLAFSKKEPGASAKLFKNFMKNNECLNVKNLAMGGELFGKDKLEEISKLPSRRDALGMLCNVLNAPVTKLTRTINEVPAQAVRVFASVSKVK